MDKNSFEKEKNRVKEALEKEGVSAEQAEIVSDCFVTADFYNVTSHGTSVLPSHIERIKRGAYNLNPKFEVLKETAAFAVIDGDNAIGAVSADYCMQYAVNKSKETGVFTVFSKNNNTFGPAFYYSLKAAKKGKIGFICSNSPAQMAPMGGVEKMLGTNPFSAVIPVPNSEPIIIDMATSAVAKSKILEYEKQGKELPQGWATDKYGNPTTNPKEALDGLVLPMASFKGYAISMLIDILAGALSGAAFLNHVGRFYCEYNNSMNVGFYITVIDPYIVFGEEYDEIIKQYVSEIRDSKAADGKKIVLPGDDRIGKTDNN